MNSETKNVNNNDNNNDTKNSLRSDEVTKRLLELIDRYNYQLVQENGQRRLTSVDLNPRTKGAEIFLGRLPRDCYEDELVPLLMKIGKVIELRLMMDFSGSTRGYAFASFDNPRTARAACQELNGHEIRPGHKIGVVKSIDNCRLFLGGVPKDKTKTDFMVELGKMLDGITNIYVYPSTEDKTLNRGFVFVEFKDHRSAAMARRKLIPGRVMLWDHEVAVDWADPEPGQDIDDEIMETVSALFVRNLSLTATESETRHIIQRLTGVQVMKIKKINHFAFLHYETRAQAQRVLDIVKQSRGSETSEWELTWAKPIRKSEKLQERLHCVKNEGKQKILEEINRCGEGGDEYKKNRQNEFNNNKDKKKKNFVGQKVITGGNKYRDRNSCSGGSSESPDSVGSSISPTMNNNDNNNNNNYYYFCNYENQMIPFDSNKVMDYNNTGINTTMNSYMTMIDGNQTPQTTLSFQEEYCNEMQFYAPNDRIVRPCADTNDDAQLNECARGLAELAAGRFHANLRYQYWSNALGNEYFCKIILERNGCELMSYQGNSAPTIHEAIRSTVPNAFARLQSLQLVQTMKYV